MTGSSPFAEPEHSLNSVKERGFHGALRSQQPTRTFFLVPVVRRPMFFLRSALANALGVASGEGGLRMPYAPRWSHGLPFATSQARIHARRLTHKHFNCRG